MDLEPYQLEPALQALRQPRSRILIADAVGLGKTLEAGILATELIQRGRQAHPGGDPEEHAVPEGVVEPLFDSALRLDSLGLARVRNRIPSNHNPFNYFDRSIISIDTLKNNLEYATILRTPGGTSSSSMSVTMSRRAPQSRASRGGRAWPRNWLAALTR